MSETIGGFIGSEDTIEGQHWYRGTCLSTGRACLTYLLEQLKPTKVFLPHYTCNALYEPILQLGIPYGFYNIDHSFEIDSYPKLNEKDILIYVNYFGIKSTYTKELEERLGDQLIVDCTQAFFNIPEKVPSFVSMRKFFGLPDGAYCFSAGPLEIKTEQSAALDTTYLELRSKGDNTSSYQGFLNNEKALSWQVIEASTFTQKRAASINYTTAIERRRENFQYLQKELGGANSLSLHLAPEEVPLCYPLLPEKTVNRSTLHKNGFFVPSYWNDVLERNANGSRTEMDISQRLLPLPLDQRYNTAQMARMAKFVLGLV